MQNKVITMQSVIKEFVEIYGRRPAREAIKVFYKFYTKFMNPTVSLENVQQIILGGDQR